MSMTLRPAAERGHANHGWLDTHHSFSFAHYYDPAHMGFRSLRVINDDVVGPGAGFPTHGHRDMEILTYVVSGALEHRDSTGAQAILKRGGVQQMSAGTGIRHSEFNASRVDDLRLLQIWILPEREGLAPGHREATVSDAEKRNVLKLIAAPEGGDVLPIRQDARIYASVLEAGRAVSHEIAPGRGVWVQMVQGALDADGVRLVEGDGLAVETPGTLTLTAGAGAEFLLFDLG
ncbi:putative Quercetin 2,3-dioxygenase [uncultured Alphaproteobacteria bacterium]|uniref:Putative Quercetin 2,3-dioxygenase n=1 Tax=uncultured Alphaproteobacteria bacterium TaxID=91750 RepID=A0A212K429_9PROT|nr:putative Quercetin 2,3-dioxygenase [uncultured Alphaproteobacteria bacterium]